MVAVLVDRQAKTDAWFVGIHPVSRVLDIFVKRIFRFKFL